MRSLFPSAYKAAPPMRHGWAWLNADWADSLLAPVDPAVQQLIDEWRGRDFPFVVAASGGSDSPCALRLGLATPDKLRCGFNLDSRAVSRTVPPLPLREVISAAPVKWRARLSALDAAADRAGVKLSVYGSLAWTCQSGISFLRADSDVDLLLAPSGGKFTQIHAFLDVLARDEGTPRLDGELVFDGAAVSWRELAQRPESLLVKSLSGPCMQSRSQVEQLLLKACA